MRVMLGVTERTTANRVFRAAVVRKVIGSSTRRYGSLGKECIIVKVRLPIKQRVELLRDKSYSPKRLIDVALGFRARIDSKNPPQGLVVPQAL